MLRGSFYQSPHSSIAPFIAQPLGAWRLARNLLATLRGCRGFTLCKTAHHQGYDTMTLYYISFSEKINSVTNNNAIYVLGSFYNIKCHPVTRRQIVSCSYQIILNN